MAKKIIVTGGNGFIGSALVEELLKTNYEVSVLDYIPGNKKGVQYYPLDIRNKEEVQKCIDKIKPEVIIHLAGLINGDYENMYKTNVLGTKNILDAFQGRSIFLSTGMIYQGNPTPYKETMLLNPQDNYAKSKKLGEELFLQKRDAVVIRTSLVYGPNQNGIMFIPYLREFLRKKIGAFKMTKGEQKRDFIHIQDLINAITLLIEHPYTGILNISSGQNIELKEVIKIAKEIVGNFQIENSIPYREQELWDYCLDNSKAKKELNWEPKIRFKDGLKETLLSP